MSEWQKSTLIRLIYYKCLFSNSTASASSLKINFWILNVYNIRLGCNLWFLLWKVEEDDLLTFFDGMNEDSNILEKLSGNYGTFGISTTGNSLFIKFEIVNSGCIAGCTWRGFHATIDYGTYNNIYSMHTNSEPGYYFLLMKFFSNTRPIRLTFY